MEIKHNIPGKQIVQKMGEKGKLENILRQIKRKIQNIKTYGI